jgi:Ca2+-binding RTX toxin-like protein
VTVTYTLPALRIESFVNDDGMGAFADLDRSTVLLTFPTGTSTFSYRIERIVSDDFIPEVAFDPEPVRIGADGGDLPETSRLIPFFGRLDWSEGPSFLLDFLRVSQVGVVEPFAVEYLVTVAGAPLPDFASPAEAEAFLRNETEGFSPIAPGAPFGPGQPISPLDIPGVQVGLDPAPPPGPTDGPDDLTLTNAPDFLDALAGDDVVRALGGDDVVSGGEGADSLFGDDGFDSLSGGPGPDLLFGEGRADVLDGGPGDDRIDGGSGNDVLRGDEGNDALLGREGGDSLFGGWGDDTLVGGLDDDDLRGGPDDDSLEGDEGSDRLDGGPGNDVVRGGAGDDLVGGSGGNDTLLGGAGADTLAGGDGHDLLDGGAGADLMNGGEGSDVYVVDRPADVVRDFGTAGTDELRTPVSWVQTSSGIERFVAIGDRAVRIDGTAADEAFFGNAGANILVGGGGIDRMEGRAGADTFVLFGAGVRPDIVASDFARAQGDRLAIDDQLLGLGGVGVAPRAVDPDLGLGLLRDGTVGYSGRTGLLTIDTDGDGAVDATIKLAGGTALGLEDVLIF